MNTKVHYTEHQIALWMEDQGLDYLVQHFMDADHVEDPAMRLDFKAAKSILDRIERRLKPHLHENQDYEDEDYCILDK